MIKDFTNWITISERERVMLDTKLYAFKRRNGILFARTRQSIRDEIKAFDARREAMKTQHIDYSDIIHFNKPESK